MPERADYPDGASHSAATGMRTVWGILGLFPALLLPHVLVPLAVPAGTWCDLLVGGCQILLSIVLVVVVPREGSGWGSVVLVMLAVGFYWAMLRLEVDLSIVGVALFGLLWINAAKPVPDSTGGWRIILALDEPIQQARRAHRLLVLLVCAGVVECFLVLFPDGPKPSVILYCTFLVTVVGAVVVYINLRFALLEGALSDHVSGSTDAEHRSAHMSAGASGTIPEDTSGLTEES